MKKYYIVLEKYEKGIIINALNDKRNVLIKEERYIDAVDEVLLKVVKAKQKDLRLDIRRIKIIKKTIFEQMGETYAKIGDYYLPNLISAEDEIEICVWGQRHLRYIKQHHKV